MVPRGEFSRENVYDITVFRGKDYLLYRSPIQY